MNNNNPLRIYYMREQIINPVYNATHRGAPVAVVITEINRDLSTIRYALSTAHPNDRFDKKIAVHIAKERLNGFDKNGKSKSVRKRGAHNIVGKEVEYVLSIRSGHEITKLVMRDIFASANLPQRVRNIAGDWLDFAQCPKNKKVKVHLSAQSKAENIDVFVKDIQRFEALPTELGHLDKRSFI